MLSGFKSAGANKLAATKNRAIVAPDKRTAGVSRQIAAMIAAITANTRPVARSDGGFISPCEKDSWKFRAIGGPFLACTFLQA
jgi:hypothetical protein